VSADIVVTEQHIAELRLAFDWHDGPVVELPPEVSPWAAVRLAALGRRTSTPVPPYGSPKWDALADDEPAKYAALVRGAEAWRQHCSPEQVAADLRRELADVDRQTHERLRATSNDVSEVAGRAHRYVTAQLRRAVPVVPQPRRSS